MCRTVCAKYMRLALLWEAHVVQTQNVLCKKHCLLLLLHGFVPLNEAPPPLGRRTYPQVGYTLGACSSYSFYFIMENDHRFEGTEKNLEVLFRRKPSHARCNTNLCSITQQEWDGILQLAGCQILKRSSNDKFDAYVLSESSLF